MPEVSRPQPITDPWVSYPGTVSVSLRVPRSSPFGDDGIESHAARLMLLLKHAIRGKDRAIVGRLKIAKMDFFLRYPAYLKRAAEIKGVDHSGIPQEVRPESRMIRYKYGPWDAKYYDVFAYLVGKGFVEIVASKHGDIFRLTDLGSYATDQLEGPEFDDMVVRCTLVRRIFGANRGTEIKNFIYEYFPEIVAKSLGEEIE